MMKELCRNSKWFRSYMAPSASTINRE